MAVGKTKCSLRPKGSPMSLSRSASALRRAPLASCIAVLWLSAPIGASATTWIVNSCSDANSGDFGTRTGTLRFAVGNAFSGDSVDMSGLACSSISLLTGAVGVPQDDLKVFGPGTDELVLSGGNVNQIFYHSGVGTLSLYGMSIANGYTKDSASIARGGCIESVGNLSLYKVNVNGCSAHSVTGKARGGALYAHDLRLRYSALTSNVSDGGSDGSAQAGGAYVTGDFYGRHSTVSYNTSTNGAATDKGFCGGMRLLGQVDIQEMTVAGNHARGNVGGLCIASGDPYATNASISNSTISGNSASGFWGGIYADAGKLQVSNSTIAFNHATLAQSDGSVFSPGLSLVARFSSISMTLESSLLTDNTFGPALASENDLSTETSSHAVVFYAGSSNNLVRASVVPNLPPDTKGAAFCALLGPLRDNGGSTPTHALMSHSPAIDQGSNSLALKEDQRGVVFFDVAPYLYPRESNGQADIGAYEVNQADIVFNSAFDGCTPLP